MTVVDALVRLPQVEVYRCSSCITKTGKSQITVASVE
jgi:hypothetical protein